MRYVNGELTFPCMLQATYRFILSIHISYRLLATYDNCNGMNFVDWDILRGKKFLWWTKGNGICKLFDRFDYDVKLIKDRDSFRNNSIVVLKLTSQFDNCTTLFDLDTNKTALSRYEECVNTAMDTTVYKSLWTTQKRKLPTALEYVALPKLHILIFITEWWYEHNRDETDKIASHWNCYAGAHGYLFTLSILPDMLVAEFFYRRHQYLLDFYLHTAQHVVFVDADSIVFNMAASFDRFLSRNNDYSIQLQFRENGEIAASIYILKNDMYSVCFMQYWLEFYPPIPPEHNNVDVRPSFIDVPNSDNGALVAAVALLAAVRIDSELIYLQCLQNLHQLHTYVITHTDNTLSPYVYILRSINPSQCLSLSLKKHTCVSSYIYFCSHPFHLISIFLALFLFSPLAPSPLIRSLSSL